MKFGLTYDLRSEYLALGYGLEETAEFDREATIDALANTLTALGHRVERIGNVRSLAARLSAGLDVDAVFNIAEGLNGYGREAQVPALLDAFEIPYTFSDPLVLCVALHKATTKCVLRAAGIPTPDFRLIESPADLDGLRLAYPLFVKPVAEGTSKGCDLRSLVHTYAELEAATTALLARFKQPVLVERFLPGREVTVGIIGTGAQARAAGTMEVQLLAGAEQQVYSYANKENSEELVNYRLADGAFASAAQTLALAAWRALGARDAGRVDLRANTAGDLEVIEINPLPGLHPEHSDLPILCTLAGIGYRDLIAGIVNSAEPRIIRRPPHRAAA